MYKGSLNKEGINIYINKWQILYWNRNIKRRCILCIEYNWFVSTDQLLEQLIFFETYLMCDSRMGLSLKRSFTKHMCRISYLQCLNAWNLAPLMNYATGLVINIGVRELETSLSWSWINILHFVHQKVIKIIILLLLAIIETLVVKV